MEEATGDALGLRLAKGLMLNSMREAISPGYLRRRGKGTALMPPQADYAESPPVLKGSTAVLLLRLPSRRPITEGTM
jgi:hypothetical protein